MGFDEMPEAVGRNAQTLDIILGKITRLEELLADLRAGLPEKTADPLVDNGKLFGIWHRNEIIRMNDRRLYEGPSAPFTSYSAVVRAKQSGCPFFTRKGQKLYCITAQALFDYINNTDLRRKLRCG